MLTFFTRAKQSVIPVLFVVGILVIGGYLRFLNLDWDQGQHLHPDERFLVMVVSAMEMPPNFKVYLDPYNSMFNPANIGYTFYVYGDLPLTITKLLAIQFDQDHYGGIGLLGRVLSAALETTMIVLVFVIAWRLQKRLGWRREVKFVASFFYAITAFAIQQAHFFTADSFGVFFSLSALAIVLVLSRFRLLAALLSGALMGLSLACKINFILFAPVVYWFLIGVQWQELKKWSRLVVIGKLVGRTSILTAIFVLALLYCVKIASPYYFNSLALYDVRPNELFLSNLAQLKSFSDPKGLFPPSVQWIGKPKLIFPLVNMIFVGFGPPLFILAAIGLAFELYYGLHHLKKSLDRLVFPLWLVVFFVFQGVQFVMTMRYFYIMYPLMAIFAGVGVMQVMTRLQRLRLSKSGQWQLTLVWLLIMGSCLIWPFSFISIYLYDHSRVQASYWMYEALPDGAVIGSEEWDDGLPVSLPASKVGDKQFDSIQMHVFYPDNEEKWEELEQDLQNIDYYVISSNRAWGSIGGVPDRYPLMSAYYDDLFNGKTEFQLIQEFHSYPSLQYLGLPLTFPDQWAEEAFTVYDHPVVYVFEKLQ